MGHKNFKIYAFYFLLNKAFELNDDIDDEHFFPIKDTCIEMFLERGILIDEAVLLLSKEWVNNTLSDRVLDNLVRSAMYILSYDIDFCSNLYQEDWILIEEFVFFFKEYIIPMDRALRTILTKNFIYAPLCKITCYKPCKSHCDNNCHWDMNNKCIIFAKHPNLERCNLEKD